MLEPLPPVGLCSLYCLCRQPTRRAWQERGEGTSGSVRQLQNPREGSYSLSPGVGVVCAGAKSHDALYQQPLLPSLKAFLQSPIAVDLLPPKPVRDRKDFSVIGAVL